MRPTRSDHLGEGELAKLGLSRETDLRLDVEGRFFQGTQPVEHAGVAAAFASWISRADDGRFALRNALHYVYLTVEGAPLHAARVSGSPPEPPTLELTGGERELLQPASLRRDPQGVLYADGRDGSWTIRLAPQAALDLAPWLAERDGEVELVVGDQSWPIPEVADPLG